MKKNVAYKTKKLGCKKKMDNSWAPRKQKWGKVKWVGYLGYKDRNAVQLK